MGAALHLCSVVLRSGCQLPVADRPAEAFPFHDAFLGRTDRRTEVSITSRNCWRWVLGRVEVSQGALKPGKVLGSLHDLCWFYAECRLERCGIPWEVSVIRRANTGNFTPVDLWTQPKPVASAT